MTVMVFGIETDNNNNQIPVAGRWIENTETDEFNLGPSNNESQEGCLPVKVCIGGGDGEEFGCTIEGNAKTIITDERNKRKIIPKERTFTLFAYETLRVENTVRDFTFYVEAVHTNLNAAKERI